MANLPFESHVNVTQAGKMYTWDGWCEATSETMREKQRVKGEVCLNMRDEWNQLHV